jgi:O-antigen/teichoic acid export membrane protein
LYALILLVGADAAGEFSVALLFVEVVRFAPNALGLILFPALTRVDECGELDRFMARASRNLVFVTGLTALIGIALVPHITALVFGPEYAGIVTGVRVMLVAAAFGVGYQIFSRYFTSRHLQSYNIAIACASLLAALVSSVALIPRFGFVGGAWAFLVGQAASGVLMVWAFSRLSGRSAVEALIVRGADLVHMRDSMLRFLARVA